jgi:hypothetical protein
VNAEAATADAPVPAGRRGFKAELDGLRQWMRELGYGPAAIAAEFARRCGIRPREGYRLAQGWSLEEAAERFNEHADQQNRDRQKRLTGSRLAELERWPDTAGTPPTPGTPNGSTGPDTTPTRGWPPTWPRSC